MHSTAKRVKRVQQRAKALHRKRENRLLGGLGFLSAALMFSVIGAIRAIQSCKSGDMVSGFYGAMLLYEDAGGYVLAAVLSFVAAVVITALCMRYRDKIKKHKCGDKEEEQKK